MPSDLAPKSYWDRSWRRRKRVRPVDPRRGGPRGLFERQLHHAWSRLLAGRETFGRRLIEVGCAGSRWLPYFHREHGFAVSGLDYSELGCAQARELLAREGIEGEIHCADLFKPPAELVGAADVAVSFGVVEHFRDTAGCVAAIARLVRPGGLVVTQVPNLVGWIGALQKRLNRPVYDMHVPLGARALGEVHSAAGLEVEECDYLVSTGFHYANLAGVPRASPRYWLGRAVLTSLVAASVAVWFTETATGPFPARRAASPIVQCAARRPDGGPRPGEQ